jgi:hypothetical protein
MAESTGDGATVPWCELVTQEECMEQPIVITNREELIFMLSEAAQLEHMLMCEYLFAAFSLKQSEDEGLTSSQLESVKRWEAVVSGVAAQEMLHLALVTNLLTAVGGAPYLTRPNFPQQARYFPPGVQLALLPFGEHALRHFLYLERPEGMKLDDAPEFEVIGASVPITPTDDIVPALEDFATVGHLYRGIEQGFSTLVDRYGEEHLFIGPANLQASAPYFGWPELITVTDLASATTAIETIVEEGEGARGDWANAHYGRFLEVFKEYTAMRLGDAPFEPARAVVAAFTRPPADVDTVQLIGDPATHAVANLFNGCYEVLLQLLNRFFIHTEETPAELQTLSRAAIRTMASAVKPLGRLLTTMPVGPDLPGMAAGPGFEIFRTGYLLPHRDPAWTVLHERLLELAGYAERAHADSGAPRDLAGVAASLRQVADDLAAHQRARGVTVPTTPTQTTSTTGGTAMVRFAQDIRPLFRDKDTQAMSFALDLGSYDDVKSNAEGIYQRLAAGTMPCDGAWPPEQVARFKQWMDDGCPA